jgi:hypothetical protein
MSKHDLKEELRCIFALNSPYLKIINDDFELGLDKITDRIDLSINNYVVPLEGIQTVQIEKNDSLKKQIGGDHYKKMTLSPWEIIEKNNLNFFEGNALKYLLRYKSKNGIQDLEKAKHYIDYLIEGLKNEEN